MIRTNCSVRRGVIGKSAPLLGSFATKHDIVKEYVLVGKSVWQVFGFAGSGFDSDQALMSTLRQYYPHVAVITRPETGSLSKVTLLSRKS
ncbi:hypothetical protein AGR4C_pb20092 [Agrobacterium tumefaciens str. Kerr 14]|uniref:Uncharacterized protein n=1 Tax=Agrobacterium tumefaciens str. Kerr 14 TaxID=1183424 RepID=A0A1S7SDU3_AGRTU|nr:hypothetical protein AGR4C_pb20092 [Agrobacterium tumefaciens str. Kerr 14]